MTGSCPTYCGTSIQLANPKAYWLAPRDWKKSRRLVRYWEAPGVKGTLEPNHRGGKDAPLDAAPLDAPPTAIMKLAHPREASPLGEAVRCHSHSWSTQRVPERILTCRPEARYYPWDGNPQQAQRHRGQPGTWEKEPGNSSGAAADGLRGPCPILISPPHHSTYRKAQVNWGWEEVIPMGIAGTQ